MQTTRIFECPQCHAEVIEPAEAPATTPARSGEFAARRLHCPRCAATVDYDTGAVQSGDSPLSAIVACTACDTSVEAYGVTEAFVQHIVENPRLHDLHRR